MFLAVFLACTVVAFCLVTVMLHLCLLFGALMWMAVRLMLLPFRLPARPPVVLPPPPARTMTMHGVEYADGQRQFVVNADDYRRMHVTPRHR